MSTIKSILQPDEKILWEKPKASARDYVWGILKQFLVFLGWNALYLLMGLFLAGYFYFIEKNPELRVERTLFGITPWIEFIPFFAFVFFLYFLILVAGQLINLSGEFALTDRRIIRKAGLAKVVISCSDIQNIFFTRNQLFLRYKSGRRTKTARIELRKKDYGDFLPAYNDLKQNSGQ